MLSSSTHSPQVTQLIQTIFCGSSYQKQHGEVNPFPSLFSITHHNTTYCSSIILGLISSGMDFSVETGTGFYQQKQHSYDDLGKKERIWES